MNTEKVGRFIAERRKEKNLTQKQLADLLGVTDKAVSRWETGKGYPDIEILRILSEKLNVSLNELLSGEKIPEEKIIESAEEHIVYAYRKEKKTKKKSRIIVAAVLICCVLICSVFAVNYSKGKEEIFYATVKNADRTEMLTKLEYVLWEEFAIGGNDIYEHTVCTDFDIRMNNENEILEFSMILLNNAYGYKTEITGFQKEKNQIKIVHSLEDRKNLTQDGFTYSSIMDALKNIDLVSLCRKHTPQNENYSEIWVSFAGETTFSDSVAQFGSDYQYLYKDGELIFADTTEILEGKNYVFALIPKVQVGSDEVYASCCNIYIKR